MNATRTLRDGYLRSLPSISSDDVRIIGARKGSESSILNGTIDLLLTEKGGGGGSKQRPPSTLLEKRNIILNLDDTVQGEDGEGSSTRSPVPLEHVLSFP